MSQNLFRQWCPEEEYHPASTLWSNQKPAFIYSAPRYCPHSTVSILWSSGPAYLPARPDQHAPQAQATTLTRPVKTVLVSLYSFHFQRFKTQTAAVSFLLPWECTEDQTREMPSPFPCLLPVPDTQCMTTHNPVRKALTIPGAIKV